MTQSQKRWHGRLSLISFLAVGGAIAGNLSPISAQVIGDGTLGTTINPTGTLYQITGGTTIGDRNLFHSFNRFDIPTGGVADFQNGLSIENIFARITGGTRSDIQGLIQTRGTANLFLINPNGIVFGPNALLNVGGSFIATTADAIQFGDRGFFSTSVPTPPIQLLTINPSALLFSQGQSQPIINRSSQAGVGLFVPPGRSLLLVGGDVTVDGGRLNAPGGRIELGGVATSGTVGLTLNQNALSLSFPPDLARSNVAIRNGSLVNVSANGGGSITINSRNLDVERSMVLAGIQAGQQAVRPADDLTLDATDTIRITRSDVLNLVQATGVGKGGNVNIKANSLLATDGTRLGAQTLGQGDTGNIIIHAGSILLTNYALMGAAIERQGSGNTGNVIVYAQKMELNEGAAMGTTIAGRGKAGDVNITVQERILLRGIEDFRVPSGVYATVQAFGEGVAGNIILQANSLVMENGADINSGTYGIRGNAGNITIIADDLVSLEGFKRTDNRSGIYSRVDSGTVGYGGDIFIKTKILNLKNSSEIVSETSGRGNSGSIQILASDIFSLDGGYVFSRVEPGAVGQGGDIWITTKSFLATNGAELAARTSGRGNAGNIKIYAHEASLASNAAIQTDVVNGGMGQGGNVSLEVDETLSITGGNLARTGESTRITLGILPGGIGSGGDLSLKAGTLILKNGGLIKTSTQGQGSAGNVYASVGNVDISGSIPITGLPSGIFTSSSTAFPSGNISIDSQIFRIANGASLSARSRGNGRGGNITINAARSFEAIDGGQLITNTSGKGHAGSILVNAGEQALILGSDPNYTNRVARFPNPLSASIANDIRETGPASGLFANTESTSQGQGGNIQVNTKHLTVQDGSQLTVNSQGTGNAGSLEANAQTIRLLNGGRLTAETSSAEGGNITLNVNELLLMQNNNLLSTTAGTAQAGGNGGNIRINGGFIVALPSENSDIKANAFTGQGGRVDINAQGIFGIQPRPLPTQLSDITASSQFGISGTVTINTLNVDPNRGLVVLPANLEDASQKIAQGCRSTGGQRAGRFVATGRGGLPPDPTAPLSGAAIMNAEGRIVEAAIAQSPPLPSTEIVEAQGWVVDQNGAVYLVADSETTAHLYWQPVAFCEQN